MRAANATGRGRAAGLWLAAGLGVCLGAPGAAWAADEAAAVGANVEAVVQGGRWSDAAGEGAGEGVYRVIVASQGFEHVSTGVRAQWKSDGGEDGLARIAHEAELVAPGHYSLGPPKLTRTAAGVRVELRGVATYDSRVKVVCRFELAAGGKVTVTKACGP
nr:hypothetical protein [Lysobacter enzymogenes]